MGITPIERLKSWWADIAEDQPRPVSWLSCASCRCPVSPSDGAWDGRDRVVTCSDTCAANWNTDRAF